MDLFIQRLIHNHSHGANIYTRNLKNSEDYYWLLSPVYEYYNDNKGMPQEKLYCGIFEKASIKETVKTFIENQKRAPGMVLVIGTAKHQKILTVGNQQEIDDAGNVDVIQMQEKSIFDLSSITKLFTCVVLLKLIDEGRIALTDKIGELDKRFIYLSDVTVEDLLTFRVPLKTHARIETAETFEEAEGLLFQIIPDLVQTRLYTDMGAIVLRYVIECQTGYTLYELVEKYILKPCNMVDTVIDIAAENMSRVVSNNFERRVKDTQYIVMSDVPKGAVNDGKARKLEQWKRQLYGHAGIFSTGVDMAKFAKELMSGKILDSKWLDMIGVNRTGKKLFDGGFSQFHGFLCYSKNPVATNSEVNHWLSGNAFALGGYTGNQLTIDYRNQIYVFMASNRCHNRVTSVTGESVVYDNEGRIVWSDGKKYICNKRYAYERDEYVINPAIELAIQYSFLDYLVEKDI